MDFSQMTTEMDFSQMTTEIQFSEFQFGDSTDLSMKMN